MTSRSTATERRRRPPPTVSSLPLLPLAGLLGLLACGRSGLDPAARDGTGGAVVSLAGSGGASFDAGPTPRACFRDDRPRPTFLSPVRCLAGDTPLALAVADLDGDGALDLVVADSAGADVSVMRGAGDGTFGAARTFPTLAGPTDLLIADMDGDRLLDIVVTHAPAEGDDDSGPNLLVGRGDGSFAAPRPLGGRQLRRGLLAGDFNGDGVRDLLAGTDLYFGPGEAFRPPLDLAATLGDFIGVAATDWNGDGDLDLVVLGGDGALRFLLGHSAPVTFTDTGQRQMLAPAPLSGSLALVVGDFDCDGHPDVAGTDHDGGVTVFRGAGREPLLGSSSTAHDLAVVDLDGDGRLDIAAAALFSRAGAYALALGTGDGTTFRVQRATFPLGRDSTAAAAGDFDRDGRADLAFIDADSVVSILINSTGDPPGAPGGDRTAGACSPPAPAGLGPITELASGIYDPYGLAVDETSVYVTDFDAEGFAAGSVLKIPIAGGPPVVLADGQGSPASIAVRHGQVYWTNYRGHSVMTVPIDGGTPTELVATLGAPIGIALDDTDVYFGEPPGPMGGLESVSLDGRASAALCCTDRNVWDIALHDGMIYGVAFTELFAIPVGGGMARTLAPGLTVALGVAADSQSVYFTQAGASTFGGSVTAVALSTGISRRLANDLEDPTRIVVDGSSVYWVNASYARGSLMRAPIAGGGPPVTIAWGQSQPSSLAVDDTRVYWIDRGSGQLLTMPK